MLFLASRDLLGCGGNRLMVTGEYFEERSLGFSTQSGWINETVESSI